eukprot:320238_1
MIRIAVSQYSDDLKIGMLVVGYLRRNEKESVGKVIPIELFGIFVQYYGSYLGIEPKKEEIKQKEKQNVWNNEKEEESSSMTCWGSFGHYSSSSDDSSSV